MTYSEQDLLEAKRQIDSTLHKPHETVRTLEGKENAARCKSQITLAKRRIQALSLIHILNRSFCVACGCCVKVCPLQAIQVVRGIAAQVDPDKCVGCGKCARECPASNIEIQEVTT